MIINYIKRLLKDRFISNIGWLGGAELFNRVARLATTVVLARTLTSYDYGVASIIFTIVDFGSVLAINPGFSAKLIQASDEELETVCNTSYWLNWLLCILIFIFQCLAAFPIAHFYQNNQLILPICVVAIGYLILPIYAIQATLIQRENRLKITAICTAIQLIFGNFLTIILALNGMRSWAVILPIVMIIPVGVIIYLTHHSWRPSKSFTLEKWREIVSFGLKTLGVNALSRLRMNLDYLLVGYFIGVDALGVYFFAFNAGLGISQSVINAFMSALYPHLCSVQGDRVQMKKQFLRGLKTIALIVLPLVILQSTLAPFYVPIIFGTKWVEGIPVLILICLSAVPVALSRATSQLLQALNKTHLDFYWNLIFTSIFAVSLLVAVRQGIFAVACAVLISQLIAIPVFTIWVMRKVVR
ncbi:putative polysaccharide biosynthesis protein [Calothrix sp. NIES-4071]|nr:putative polysaccharide biosynthesis protein [Calothrix sp. NIES-4071]BAZ59665.1 putative polysaccharide biosynthesis protein [Calothrix sp. NIES-4105]